jgi:hypothetical protein
MCHLRGVELAYQLDVLGGQAVEQAPSRSQQDRDDMQLQLVELARAQQRLGRACPVHRVVSLRAPIGPCPARSSGRLPWNLPAAQGRVHSSG